MTTTHTPNLAAADVSYSPGRRVGTIRYDYNSPFQGGERTYELYVPAAGKNPYLICLPTVIAAYKIDRPKSVTLTVGDHIVIDGTTYEVVQPSRHLAQDVKLQPVQP